MVACPTFCRLLQPSHPPWLLPIGDGDSDVDSEEKAWRKGGVRRDGGGCFGMWDLTAQNHKKTDVKNPDATEKGTDKMCDLINEQ